MSKEEFLKLRSHYEKTQPFNDAENEKLTRQQKNYIRGIQMVTGKNKTQATRHLRGNLLKNKENLRQMSITIQEFYERGENIIGGGGGGVLIPPPQPPKKKKKGYKYAGYISAAKIEDKKRFVVIPGKARHYTDTVTGEEIPRRERDKRVFIIVTTYPNFNEIREKVEK